MAVRTEKPLKVADVGKYFIYLAHQEKRPITNKKLQKLVYFAQAWSLVLRDKKLFSESIEAWVHGPAVRSLYVDYKKYGFDPIPESEVPDTVEHITGKKKELLDEIWKVYGKLDAGYLEMLTHSDAPWLEAREGLQDTESSANTISLSSMKTFYSQKLRASQK